MNEAHTNAVLAALEGQRNNALNGLVKTEAALTIARSRISELEQELAVFKALQQPQPEMPA